MGEICSIHLPLFVNNLKTSLIIAELAAGAIVEVNGNGLLWKPFLESLAEPWRPLLPCHRHFSHPCCFTYGCKCRYCVTASEGLAHRKGLGFVRTQRLGNPMGRYMYLKFLPVPNAMHNSSMCSSDTWVMAGTRTSVSTVCRVTVRMHYTSVPNRTLLGTSQKVASNMPCPTDWMGWWTQAVIDHCGQLFYRQASPSLSVIMLWLQERLPGAMQMQKVLHKVHSSVSMWQKTGKYGFDFQTNNKKFW